MKKILFITVVLISITVSGSAQEKKSTKATTKMEKVKITDVDRQAAAERAQKEKSKRAQKKLSSDKPMTYADQKNNTDKKAQTTSVPGEKGVNKQKAKTTTVKKEH